MRTALLRRRRRGRSDLAFLDPYMDDIELAHFTIGGDRLILDGERIPYQDPLLEVEVESVGDPVGGARQVREVGPPLVQTTDANRPVWGAEGLETGPGFLLWDKEAAKELTLRMPPTATNPPCTLFLTLSTDDLAEYFALGVVNDGIKTLFQIFLNRSGTPGDFGFSYRLDGGEGGFFTAGMSHPVDEKFVLCMRKSASTMDVFINGALERSVAGYTSSGTSSPPEYDIPVLGRNVNGTISGVVNGTFNGGLFILSDLTDEEIASLSAALEDL